ncbi:HtaA domain-containing protein [Leifsonia sp. F6_8S_P_1B]|uniref:HtaA domain-containing protein n=1 Tax=Leifsonia williamsii TaxID=3035919 RepID=A0ABT8KBL9_9MICO|nr:HtaA domain-containing protein [Leifsonia williamsii]MDN4613739.1 HtaA domain-containing protein [Leifsonia williamsii]
MTRTRSARRLLAVALAGLLAAAGIAAVPTAAFAAAPTTTVTPATGLDPAGATVTVGGTGFTPTGGGVFGVYVGVGPKSAKDNADWFTNAGYYQGVKWVSSIGADGAFSQALTGITQVFTSNGRQVDCSTEECGVYTFAAHGSADRTQDTYAPIAFAAPAVEPAATQLTIASSVATVKEGEGVTLSATVSPAAAGTVTFLDGAASLGDVPVNGAFASLTTTLAAGSHTITASFAPADPAAFAPSTSSAVTVEVTAAPQQPATPTVSVSPSTGIDPAAGTVTVTGSGFSTGGPGFYIGVGPKSAKNNADWFVKASYYQGVKWATVAGTYGAKINADGTISIALANLKQVFTSGGATVDCAAEECGVYTFAAHGSADRSQDTYTPIAFAAAAPQPVTTSTTLAASASSVKQGDTVTLTATVAPAAAGAVAFFDGSAKLATAPVAAGAASVAVTSLAVGTHALTATFTPADATAFTASTSAAVSVGVATKPQPTGPTITAPEVPVNGGTITVTGRGFSAAAPGIYLGVGPAGLPGFYAGSSQLVSGNTIWIGPGNAEVPTGEQRMAPLKADGTFSVTLTIPAPTATVPAYAIYTSKAHGQGLADKSQDTVTALTYAKPAQPPVEGATKTSLAIDVQKVTGADDALDVTVTVTPAADGTITLSDRGAVVASGLRLKPDTSALTTAALSTAATAKALAAGGSSSVTARLTGLSSGTHSFTAAFTPDDPAAFAPSAAPAVEQAVQPAAVVADPIPQASRDEPAAPVCVARSVSGASLAWGVKSSFRSYISGGIANGSWSLSGVGYDGGAFTWSGGTGSFNPSETRGLVRFPGSVSFTGHEGTLNLVLSNIAVRITSPGSATLIADVHSTDMAGTPADYASVAFASIALDGGTSGSAYSAEGAAATLTADGAKAFAGFYTAGAALDPITLRLPLGGDVECDSTTTTGLASTGSTGSGGWPLIGGLLLLSGVAAVVAVRRRAARTAADTIAEAR